MAYGAAAAPPEQSGRLAYKWKVLISVIFGIFMIILDTTVVNVAFQTIHREYGASLSDLQWVISVYVLALGIATPMSGFLSDRFGIKRMYVGGLALFVLGSLLCGLAPTISPSIWLLVAARALQGIGGGIAQPLGSALLFSTFPPREQGMALGIFGIALVVAPALDKPVPLQRVHRRHQRRRSQGHLAAQLADRVPLVEEQPHDPVLQAAHRDALRLQPLLQAAAGPLGRDCDQDADLERRPVKLMHSLCHTICSLIIRARMI